jgi:hypothetical protein
MINNTHLNEVHYSGGSQAECRETTQYDQVDIQYINNYVNTHQYMIHEVIGGLISFDSNSYF